MIIMLGLDTQVTDRQMHTSAHTKFDDVDVLRVVSCKTPHMVTPSPLCHQVCESGGPDDVSD